MTYKSVVGDKQDHAKQAWLDAGGTVPERGAEAPPPDYGTNLAPAYIAEQIFFHVLLKGGEGNPFQSIHSQWFVELAAPKIRELLEHK